LRVRLRHATCTPPAARGGPTQALRARGADAEIVYSEAPRFHGVLRPREYVTCDAEAPRERFFVCKSVKARKGGAGVEMDEGIPRPGMWGWCEVSCPRGGAEVAAVT
jgi:hypothetical protein